MTGNALSLGRNHALADLVSITEFADCFRVDVCWLDGGRVYMLHDTKTEALKHVHSLGWQ